MKKKYVFLLILFLFILSPISAYSTPVLYSVDGDWDGRDVFGTMVIEDSYYSFGMSEEPGYEDCGGFVYHIENFTFGNSRDLFYGHHGWMDGHFRVGNWCEIIELMLVGEGHSQGAAIKVMHWWGIYFENEDGPCIAVQEGCPLPPRMLIESLVPGFPGLDPYIEITLELERITPQSQPVPEPATMLLLGAGLIGLAGLRRKFRKR